MSRHADMIDQFQNINGSLNAVTSVLAQGSLLIRSLHISLLGYTVERFPKCSDVSYCDPFAFSEIFKRMTGF